MHLSVKVKRLSVWLNACGPLPQAFVLDDATWLNERLEIRRKPRPTNALLISKRKR
jgi:hypothetical protein